MDELGTEDFLNQYVNWVDLDRPENRTQTAAIASMLDSSNIEEDADTDEDEDTLEWKSHVPDWVHDFGDIFSKKRSERMPI